MTQAHRKPITLWCDPLSPIKTIHGTLSYSSWCKREALRQTRLGRLAKVAYAHGKCAVVHTWS